MFFLCDPASISDSLKKVYSLKSGGKSFPFAQESLRSNLLNVFSCSINKCKCQLLHMRLKD